MVIFQETIYREFTKGGVYVMNLDDKESKVAQWVLLIIDENTTVFFDSFGVLLMTIKRMTR